MLSDCDNSLHNLTFKTKIFQYVYIAAYNVNVIDEYMSMEINKQNPPP